MDAILLAADVSMHMNVLALGLYFIASMKDDISKARLCFILSIVLGVTHLCSQTGTVGTWPKEALTVDTIYRPINRVWFGLQLMLFTMGCVLLSLRRKVVVTATDDLVDGNSNMDAGATTITFSGEDDDDE